LKNSGAKFVSPGNAGGADSKINDISLSSSINSIFGAEYSSLLLFIIFIVTD